MYHELGYRKKGIIEKLGLFMEKNYPRYNPVDWESTIERYANKAGKYKLIECDGVWITKKEIKVIQDLHNKVLQRLAFTLLCLAKFRNFRNPDNNNWVCEESSEIYRLANINTTAFDKELRFNTLMELGLIEYAKKVNNLNVQLKYVYEDSERIFKVKDFRALGNEWRLYCGEKYIRCADCGLLVRDNKCHTKKYCNECFSNNRKEYKKIKQRQYRNKNVDTMN